MTYPLIDNTPIELSPKELEDLKKQARKLAAAPPVMRHAYVQALCLHNLLLMREVNQYHVAGGIPTYDTH